MQMTNITDHAARFFEVEIRNETQGGVSPSTLQSALDSLLQAPSDVVADWAEIPYGQADRGRNELIAEVRRLIESDGGGFELENYPEVRP